MFPENAAQRSFQACLECRRSKLKCDGLQHVNFQCSRCTARDKVCVWPAPIPTAMANQGVHQQPQQQQQHHQMNIPPLYGNPSTSSSAIHRDASINEDPQSSSSSRVGQFQQLNTYPNQESIPTSNPKRPRVGNRNRRRNTSNSDQRQMVNFTSSTSTPYDSLRSVALLSPEEAILQHHSQGQSITRLQNPSESSRSIDTQTNRGEGMQTEGQGDIGTDQFSIGEEDNLGDILDDEEEDEENRNEYSILEHKQSIDEQIMALQDRMGWTQERLHEASVERRNFFTDAIAPEPSEVDKLDPILSGILQPEDVERLFGLFYETINVQHCLLDERYDTWQSVQKLSRSLFITICAISASIDDQHAISRHCSPILLRSMDHCSSLLLSSNSKSTEVVKVYLLTFLFMTKPPFAREDRCWTLIDTAGRIASELGMGKRLRTVRSTLNGQIQDDHEQRSTERAWATAVLLQRSLGSLHGMVSVINLDVHWGQLDRWAEDENATPGDAQHCAYLNLRRIEFYTRSQLQKMEEHRFLSLESIRVSFNTLFESWQQRYVQQPKLAGHFVRKSVLMVVGFHIQLLINVTVLHTSKISDQPMYMVPDTLEEQCAKLSINFCQFFLDNFQYRAHQLGRNMISMVTWSVMIMLQLKYREQRLMATRLAILLAGTGTDHLHSSSFARFSGRWLLSLINDLAKASSERKAAALLRYKKFDFNTNYRFPGFPNNEMEELQPEPEADLTINAGDQSGVERGQSLSVDQLQQSQSQANPPNSTDESHADSTENILSNMSGHMTTDPFNEVWLNSFLDSLVPPSITPSNDHSGSTSMSNLNSAQNESNQDSNQYPFEPGSNMGFHNQ